MNRNILIAGAVIIIAGLGAWWLVWLNSNRETDELLEQFAWTTADAPERDGIPQTSVTLRVAGTDIPLGTYDGSCTVVEDSEWELLPNELSGIICWWAGGGIEIGMFEEPDGQLALKKGIIEEANAEGGGFRGNFVLLTRQQ